jgi:poly(beta-D-mannuronate) lyase
VTRWLRPGAAGLCVALVACAAATGAPQSADAATAGAAASTLVPPQGFTAAVRNKRNDDDAEECAAAPRPFTGALGMPSKYEGSDKARDDLNPKAEAAYEAQTSDIRLLEKTVSSMVSHYLHSGRPELLDCTLNWLNVWARAGALRGKAETHTGKSVRKWALASLASAYVRLKFSASRPLANEGARTQPIEAWLAQLGDLVVADWKDQPKNAVNNHQYWAAWAVMADAVALNRRDLFDWALAQYRYAATQVDADGYLANELKRDTRALAYHNYSLGPLAMIAAFAKANGVDLADTREPMQRLAQRVLTGVDNPKQFESKTGEKQTREGIDEYSKFAWMEAYCWTFGCAPPELKRMERMRPLKTYRLGGNLTELFGPPPAKKAESGSTPSKDDDES